MMKNKGFIFIELLMVMGIFTMIIFPMVMLMNKNIKLITVIRTGNEIERTAENIENIVLNLIENKKHGQRYFLEFNSGENSAFFKDDSGKNITQLRSIKYISKGEAVILKKKIFYEEEGMEKEFGNIYILELKLNDKKIRKVLKSDEI